MTWLAKGGGVDQNVFLTIRDLKEEQDIHLAVGSEIHHNPFAALDGVKFFVCPDLVRPINPLKDLKALWYFYRLIKRERYDIIHTHETKAGLITRLAAYLAGCGRVIYGLHGVTFNDPLSRFRRSLYIWVEKLTIGVADIVVAVSQSVVDEYRKNGIGMGLPWRVVYSGIDLAFFESRRTSSPEERARLRKALGIGEDDIVLINVGRFSPAKAQRFTIEAFARLKKRHANLKLLLVGEGELKEDCRLLAEELGVGSSTVFYGFSENVPEVLSLADIHLLTSFREGLPRVVVESYLCRVPAAAFEVEGIREIIEDGVTGFVVSQGDVDALAARADALIADPSLRRRFGELGCERARRCWDHREMIRRLRAVYQGGLETDANRVALVESFFDGYAADFDGIYGHSGRRGRLGRLVDRALRKTMFLRFQEVLKNTADERIRSILDIGCGPGHYCAEFLRQGKTVVGLDLAEGMLTLAQQAADAARRPGQVSFIKADYLRHEFEQKFDAACLMGFFDYIERPKDVLEKLRRDVSKEIYASFPRSSGVLALQRRFRYWLRDCPLYLYSREEVEAILESCGLKRYELKDFGRDYFVKVRLE